MKLKGGYTGFTLSVCGQNHVRSISSTIHVGSISYLHILSSNLRRCVACNVCFKIKKLKSERWHLCYQSYDIFRPKANYLWTLMLMILSYGWCVQKLSKYDVGIKWIMNEKLIWTPNSIYGVSWRVLKSSGRHEFVEILLSVEELMRAQLIYSIVGHMHAVWYLSVLLNIKYLKSRVSVNIPRTLRNNNHGFSLWGLISNSLTRIDEDISDIFWAAGIFLCLDQQPPCVLDLLI